MAQPAAADARGVRLSAALAASLGMLRERSIVSFGLGAAVVLSLLSVCCGIGLITTPWFMCELFAVQIALCTRVNVPRGAPFVAAAGLLLGGVLMVSAVAAMVLLGAGPELSAQTLGQESFDAVLRSGGLAALGCSVMALLIVAPWLYAPLFLLERRTRVDVALVESVQLVVAHGALDSLRLSLFAHALQASPLILASAIARALDSSQMAQFALISTPFLCVSVPLGQGVIVWTYVQLRGRAHLPDVPTRSTPPATRAERCARAWTLLIVLPVVSLLLLELSLLRPSRVPLGAAPSGELVAELRPNDDGPAARAVLPDTALEVVAAPRSVRVIASDGGGAGDLPLTAATPVTRVRVVRVRDTFVIELHQGVDRYATRIDRAGVRLDDDLRARLMDRVSPLQLFIFLCTLISTAIASVPVLYALGRVQRGYRLPDGERPSAERLAETDAQSLRRARNVALLLAPLSLACLTMAILALMG